MLGIGQDGRSTTQHYIKGAEGGGGSGGGYYGGYSSQKVGDCSAASGSGGSSYISGHEGCVKREDYQFIHTVMLSGNYNMRSKTDFYEYSVGNVGDGFARITEYSKFQPTHTHTGLSAGFACYQPS